MAIEELLERHHGGAGERAAGAARHAPGRPSLHTILVTCMDVRIDAYVLFGLSPGEVHVLRNAGGIVTDDVIRSITISQRKLGSTDVLLVHHSGCGMASFIDDEFVEELAVECGARPSWRPGAFPDAASDVRKGMDELRRSPFIASGTPIRGFVLDIQSFKLDEVLDDDRDNASS